MLDKHAGGRPLLFKSPKELQEKIDKYFQECKDNYIEIVNKHGNKAIINKPLIPTIAGLAYNIGVDRQTIYNYSEKEEFFDTIKKARDYIYMCIENGLTNFDNPTGKIFIAKNYGYTDKNEIEHSGSIDISDIKKMILNNLNDKINT
jgi:DNA-binding XRE family transcriptional regulator